MATYRLELLGKGAANDPDKGLAILTLNGREEMSQIPCYRIEALSRNASIRPNEVLMKAYSVRCEFDDAQGDTHIRHFTGHAVRFSPVPGDEGRFGRYAKYHIELRPWLWFLGLRRNCWIFQGKSTQEIIDEILQRYPSAPAAEWRVAPPRKKREYCVQYRESDLNFFSRLLEEEGIHYWFEYSPDKAVLVLGNGNHAPHALPANDSLIYATQIGSEQRYNELHRWGYESELCSDSVRLRDYDFITCETPEQTLEAEIPSHLLEDQNRQFDYFDYPAGFVEDQGDPESNPVYLDEQAEIRLAELQNRREVFVGTSEWPDIAVGYTAQVSNHPDTELNQKVVIFATQWSLENIGHESRLLPEESQPQTLCHFKAFPFQYWQRPQAVTRRPVIPGLQTAVVVGKENDEIYTDRHGRIKVRFHWDWNGSDDIKDENRSCWVRVAQLWAGNGWGTQFIPRVGHEVVVSFLEGNPDRPLVTGSVYNGRNRPTYEQPKNLTQSGIRTRSSPGGGASNYNELRFEDKKNKEQVYLHAERNLDTVIEKRETRKVGTDSFTKVSGMMQLSVGDKRTADIGGDDVLNVVKNQNIHIGGNQSVAVYGKTDFASLGDWTSAAPNITVKSTNLYSLSSTYISSVATAYHEIRAPNYNLIAPFVNVSSTRIWQHASADQQITAGTMLQIGAPEVLIEAKTAITLRCGSSSITLSPTGITIEAGIVTVNGWNNAVIHSKARVLINATSEVSIEAALIKNNA